MKCIRRSVSGGYKEKICDTKGGEDEVPATYIGGEAHSSNVYVAGTKQNKRNGTGPPKRWARVLILKTSHTRNTLRILNG